MEKSHGSNLPTWAAFWMTDKLFYFLKLSEFLTQLSSISDV